MQTTWEWWFNRKDREKLAARMRDIIETEEAQEISEAQALMGRLGIPEQKAEKEKMAKLPIDRPCSACSAGDTAMEYHDHTPPFRQAKTPLPSETKIPSITEITDAMLVLRKACDRAWTSEGLLTTATIAANAIHWRDDQIRVLREEKAELYKKLRLLIEN